MTNDRRAGSKPDQRTFRQPYATMVGDLFDMHHFWDDVVAGMPPTGRDLLTPSYRRRVATDLSEPLRVRLRQNARWAGARSRNSMAG